MPGVAIPLLQDDCIDTTVDEDWIWDYIHLTSDDKTRRLDLSTLHDEVDTWFAPDSLEAIMGEGEGDTEAIAIASVSPSPSPMIASSESGANHVSTSSCNVERSSRRVLSSLVR